MGTIHKKVSRKVIFVFLFIAFIATITGSAVASSSAAQSQSCQLSVTRDGVTYNLDQAQIAIVDNGMIRQFQISDMKITYDQKGKIKSVTVRLREVQKVSSSSTDYNIDSINVIDLSEYQDANVVTTKDSANIDLRQVQIVTEQLNGKITQNQVAVIKVKFTKHGVKVVLKTKQKLKVK
ncbi:hypothetical protein [Methanosarcina sp.]|uniref:hypothetical protein n=1 Tax=Methanosarcina sp. TaxID=2213 RepID=UPI003BB501A1